MDKTQVNSIPENETSNSDAPGSVQCFPSSFLTVGTAVSAKYRGAFCEATVDHVDLKFRLRVQLKSNKVIQLHLFFTNIVCFQYIFLKKLICQS